MGLLFNVPLARDYEKWVSSFEGRDRVWTLENMIKKLLLPQSGLRVLDIGCGTGNHLLMLNRMGLRISGLDASPEMVQLARERLGHRCDLKMGWAEDLPYDDNEFDFVLLINTLEFIDDPLPALKEAGRVASRKVLVTSMNSLSVEGFFSRVQGQMGRKLFRHARFYNILQLRSLFKRAFGDAPMSWGSIRAAGPFVTLRTARGTSPGYSQSPFGTMLGISAEMTYTLKTDNIPLKVRIKEAGQGLIGTTSFEDLKVEAKGASKNERGVSV